MRDLQKYKGVLPAFYACYDAEGNVCAERCKKLALYYLKVGVKGLYVGGSSGECIYQTTEERKKVLEAVMEAVGGKMTIIAHVAAASTRESKILAAHASALGVDALAAIPPIYFGMKEAAIQKYWQEIMEAGGNKDFILYNIPQTTPYTLTTKLLKEMLKDERVIGVKNSSSPVQDITAFKLAAEREIVVFNGPDKQFVPGRLAGADAGIGGTYGVMPELFLAADRAMNEGNFDKAARIQTEITKIILCLQSGQGSFYDVMKQVLAKNGLDIGQVRAPLYPVQPGDEQVVEKAHQMILEAKAIYC